MFHPYSYVTNTINVIYTLNTSKYISYYFIITVILEKRSINISVWDAVLGIRKTYRKLY